MKRMCDNKTRSLRKSSNPNLPLSPSTENTFKYQLLRLLLTILFFVMNKIQEVRNNNANNFVLVDISFFPKLLPINTNKIKSIQNITHSRIWHVLLRDFFSLCLSLSFSISTINLFLWWYNIYYIALVYYYFKCSVPLNFASSKGILKNYVLLDGIIGLFFS